MKKFKIVVWFRYMVKGSEQKDFDVYQIDADNLEEALSQTKKFYDNYRGIIPFLYYHGKDKFKPTNIK